MGFLQLRRTKRWGKLQQQFDAGEKSTFMELIRITMEMGIKNIKLLH